MASEISKARFTAVASIPMAMEYGERLTFARQRAGLSQSELARRVGMRSTSISAIETGVTRSSGSTVSMARVLDCDPYWLETGEGDPNARYPHFDATIIEAAVKAAAEAVRLRPGALSPDQLAAVVVRLCQEFRQAPDMDGRLLRAFAAGALAHLDS